MKNRHFFRRFTGLTMAVILTTVSFDVGGLYAQEESVTEKTLPVQAVSEVETSFVPSQEKLFDKSKFILDGTESNEKTMGYIDIGHKAQSVKDDSINSLEINMATTIPSSYSSVSKGYVTSVKNQRSWGTCWAFAACAAMESYALAHGYVDSASDVDFSEYALAYLTFSDDMYMDKTGDYTYTSNEYVGFDSGGNDEYAFKALTKWAGVYNDDNTQYANSVNTGVVTEYIPDEDNMDFVLTGQYYISSSDTDQIKAAIMEHGAVTGGYYSSYQYTKNNELYIYNYEYSGTNHAITVVGWDDNKDRNLFTMTDSSGTSHTPTSNGAWLIKNSWGTYYGNNGYCWISYEDYGFNSGDAVVYEVSPKSYYDNIYQYDGATLFLTSLGGLDFAAVYEIEGDVNQTIEAVSFSVLSTNVGFTVKVYKNTDGSTLDEGELLATEDGVVTFEGYYTVPIDDTVTVEPGDIITVMVCFDEYTYLTYEYSGFQMGMYGDAYPICSAEEGRTFRRRYEGASFADCAGYGDLCLKTFTSDTEGTSQTPRITSIDDSDLSKLVIEWKKIEGASSYTLWKSTSESGANAVLIKNITGNTYTDTNVTVGTTYYYKVCAVVYGVTSGYSAMKSATLQLEPVVVEGENNGSYISLSWNYSKNVNGYKVYRSKNGGSYELVTTLGSSASSYDDYNISYGETYEYTVCAYVTINGAYYETAKTYTYSVEKEVPMVDYLYVSSMHYNKMIISWSVLEEVDGFYVYACIGDEEYYTLIDVVDGSVTEYEYDVSSLAVDTYCYFAIEPYVEVNGNIYVNDYFRYNYAWVREQPLEVSDVVWYIADYPVVRFKAEDSVYGYTIWYNQDGSKDHYSFMDVVGDPGTDGYLESEIYEYDYSKMYMYITDYYIDCMFQEESFKILGDYVMPNLSYINDVSLAKGVTTTTLTANITNKMENFEYLYQWYVADSLTGTATAISGATSSTYKATVGEGQTKYFYCSVICRYGDVKIVNTTNSVGTRTKVAGYTEVVEEVVVGNVANQTYTGSAITPNVSVKQGTKTLTKGTDYTLSYKNNINAGTATLTVTFKGNYASTPQVSRNFTINPRGITDVVVTYTGTYTYTGSAIKPLPTVKNNIGTLVNGTDYTLTYKNNINVGTASITITFKGNYTGSRTVSFTIKEAVPVTITSSSYTVNQSSTNISKISAGTTAGTLINGLNEKKYVVIKNGSKTVASTETLTTGMTANIMNGSTVVKTYYIIVTGDTNGDGKINITDMIAIKANILKKSTLSGVYAKAGDVNGDGKINITDFIKIKATLLKKDSIVGVAAK